LYCRLRLFCFWLVGWRGGFTLRLPELRKPLLQSHFDTAFDELLYLCVV